MINILLFIVNESCMNKLYTFHNQKFEQLIANDRNNV